MRSQAFLRRSRSLLKSRPLSRVSYPSPSFSLSPITAAARSPKPTPVTRRRLTTSNSVTDPEALPPPPANESPDDDGDDLPNSNEQTPEPERKTRKARMASSKEVDATALPDDLDILWTPSDSEPTKTSLPPPEIYQEALHSVNIALHPKVQHRSTYAMSGNLKEPTVSLYCPLEGGDYVIDETVRELAREIGADVVVLDAAHLAAGEWGQFGAAAKSFKLPHNPLHFQPAAPPTSISRSELEEDDEPEFFSPMAGPMRVALAVLSPASEYQGSAINLAAARRGSTPTKLKQFFDNVVNLPSQDTSETAGTRRPRLIYIRDYPTLAPSANIWYPALLAAVRQRRRGPISRPSSPVPYPMAIIFGSTPSLFANPHESSLEPQMGSPLNLLSRRPSNTSHDKNTECGEDSASSKARERRLRERLQKWEKGDWQEEVPPLRVMDDVGMPGPSSRPGIIVIGGPDGPPGIRGSLENGGDASSSSSFFRSTFIVPGTRLLEEEKKCRVSRRKELNELAMRLGIGAVGGSLEKQPPPPQVLTVEVSSFSEPVTSENASSLPELEASPQEQMWDSWGRELQVWSDVRQIADRALGSVVHGSNERSSLDATSVDWNTLYAAWHGHKSRDESRKSWIDSSSTKPSTGEEGSESTTTADTVDEVIERVRRDPDLDPHEKRLLSCIVDARSMQTTFSQVHLPAHTIDSVRTIVSLPLLHPASFQHGILKEHSMTGCLLFGPPGTGKTLLVKALAREAGCRMLSVSPSDVMDMYVGEGEKLVKAVFSLARQLSPCVVFLDEIDALFGARTSARENGGAIAHRGVITEFMQEMDGLKSSKDDSIIVVGATNRPFDLDDAVLRRLPRRLLVDLPGEPEREAILKIMLRDETLDSDVDIHYLAKQTASFSGSDLKHLCVSAALDAVKERVKVPWATTGQQSPTTSQQSPADSQPAPEKLEDAQIPMPETPRTLHARNFAKALKEITPSASDSLNSSVRKWNEEYGEGRVDRKRTQVWGKGLFGFVEKKATEETQAPVPIAPVVDPVPNQENP